MISVGLGLGLVWFDLSGILMLCVFIRAHIPDSPMLCVCADLGQIAWNAFRQGVCAVYHPGNAGSSSSFQGSLVTSARGGK